MLVLIADVLPGIGRYGGEGSEHVGRWKAMCHRQSSDTGGKMGKHITSLMVFTQ